MDDVVTVVGGKLNVMLSPLIGSFQSSLLKRMPNLKNIDVSGCLLLDPEQFSKSVVSCLQLQDLNIEDCKQFKERHLVEICTGLPQLQMMKAIHTQPIQVVSAYVIVTNCREMHLLEVEARYPDFEAKEWSKLNSMFLSVDFGPEIQKIISALKI